MEEGEEAALGTDAALALHGSGRQGTGSPLEVRMDPGGCSWGRWEAHVGPARDQSWAVLQGHLGVASVSLTVGGAFEGQDSH